MAFKRYSSIADATIVNYGEGTNEDSRYANIGGADTLEVYSIHERIYSQSAENSRILLNFDWNKIYDDRQKYVTPSSGSIRYYLKLFNVQHPETLPKNFELAVHPLSGTWVEGTGLDLETYNDYGFTNDLSYEARGVNWIYKDYNEAWNSQGADFITGSNNQYDLRQYFDDGTEDLEIEITNIIEDYFAGTIDIGGVLLKLSTDYENLYPDTDQVEKTYYTKRFSSRTSEYFFKRPILEARWEPLIKDNYPNLYIKNDFLEDADNTMSLYYYHIFGGKNLKLPDNVYNNMEFYIYSGSTILNFSASYVTTKINDSTYKFDFILDNTDPSFEQLISGNIEYLEAGYTIFSGSTTIYQEENTLKIYNRTADQVNFQDNSYTFSIKNLKPKYTNKEVANFHIYSRPINWSPNIYTKATENIETTKHNNLYYKVSRVKDGFIILDYSNTDYNYSNVGYDRNSNILEFDMSLLEPGYMYEIKFALFSDTNFDEAKETFKFRVSE